MPDLVYARTQSKRIRVTAPALFIDRAITIVALRHVVGEILHELPAVAVRIVIVDPLPVRMIVRVRPARAIMFEAGPLLRGRIVLIENHNTVLLRQSL